MVTKKTAKKTKRKTKRKTTRKKVAKKTESKVKLAPGRGGRTIEEIENLKRAYAIWLLTPKADREPKTKQELAEVLNVDSTMLSRWNHDQFVNDQIVEMLPKLSHMALPHAFEALRKLAVGGNREAIHDIFRLHGIDKLAELHAGPAVGIMSPEDAKKAQAKLMGGEKPPGLDYGE